jgi:cytochrome c oxidase subunit 1
LFQGALATDVHLHDTYWVVGHFHYVIFGGTAFAVFGALHYWFPKMFGRMYGKKIPYVAWFFLFIGFNALYFSMLILGWEGMPRRYYDYLPQFQTLQLISTIGSWILITGLILMFSNLFYSFSRERRERIIPGAERRLSADSIPAAKREFEKIPVVEKGPYDFR